ncbi:MAG: hypothetical protein IPG50_34090 [Myxococcales bacterium]|nr:hypothetical protein [Myxococcales bacterium]
MNTSAPSPEASPELRDIQEQLKALTVRWSLRKELDEGRARALRRRAAELCHEHYRAHIPAYGKVCERMRVAGPASFDTIRAKLLVPDDLFKSYPQKTLDEGRFDLMNEWVSRISSVRVAFDTTGITNIDQWIDRMEERAKVRLVFSSGTSGHISFVPRDEATWRAFTELPFLYVAAGLGHRGLLPKWKFSVVKQLGKRLPSSTYAGVVKRHGLRSRDGFLFNFAGGNQGVQLAGHEIGKLTRTAHFLYRQRMSAAAVRAMLRGPKDSAERLLVDEFLDATVKQKAENYARMLSALQASARRGNRVLVFGTPAVLVEACRFLEEKNERILLPEGSTVSYGGGWKSFSGERISEAALVALLQRSFGVRKNAVIDSYSMTEIHGIMQKCAEGRFHVPPFLEAIVYDEALVAKSGDDVQGTLGFVDPFAVSYPGFILTGDNVRLLRKPCACGLPGETILRVERSPGKDVKGCGGIMARVNA